MIVALECPQQQFWRGTTPQTLFDLIDLVFPSSSTCLSLSGPGTANQNRTVIGLHVSTSITQPHHVTRDPSPLHAWQQGTMKQWLASDRQPGTVFFFFSQPCVLIRHCQLDGDQPLRGGDGKEMAPREGNRGTTGKASGP